ncbi:MAG: NAD-dependent malic enzyme, partial [Actinobacteria bacterium]|nr:NAD-dependent malic enzyme [Actinomycetota bacterium]
MLPVVTAGKSTRSLGRVRTTSPGYSITLRLVAEPQVHARGLIVSAVAKAGAIVTALDVAEPTPGSVKIDLSCDARDSDHVAQIVAALDALDGCTVAKVSDRVFLAHLGGKLEIAVKAPMRHRDDLARIYTPGVARVCEAIAEHPEDVRRLTIKRNSVAVVTDGSAVLGLGDIGPAAAMPVMEGKAALFKRFANVDAWPICIASNDVDEIVRTVELIATGFGGINLEDIAAPRCFEIEARLRERLDIPVFHDDQHGTAIVVIAALRNALRLVGKSLSEARIVMSGAGAAGTAVCRLLLIAGARDIVMYDLDGALHRGRTDLDPLRTAMLDQMNPRNVTAPIAEALRDADVFIGLSAPGVITK